jgi:hypothetical protein
VRSWSTHSGARTGLPENAAGDVQVSPDLHQRVLRNGKAGFCGGSGPICTWAAEGGLSADNARFSGVSNCTRARWITNTPESAASPSRWVADPYPEAGGASCATRRPVFVPVRGQSEWRAISPTLGKRMLHPSRGAELEIAVQMYTGVSRRMA